jgi:hypothetical protein
MSNGGSKVLHLESELLQPETLATAIADDWIMKDTARQVWKNNMAEIIRYIYATDTTTTTNASLPWKNKTTIPKLCQILDNLDANYKATLFPTRNRNVKWYANEKDSASKAKRDSIENYIMWAMDQPGFKQEIYKCIHDYIQTGNCFVMPVWVDERVQLEGYDQVGYVGPGIRRISPFDIVMSPTAEHFHKTPKIIRSMVGMGEVKEMLERMSTDENREEYENLWKYLKEIRGKALSFEGEWQQKDNTFDMDGFSSFREYLASDTVEILTFYGDIYDVDEDVFLKNHVITVVDRHKIIGKKPNPSFFGYPPIFHAAWRKRPDNLWGMGPLDNLVGMQYRVDHIENMKADIFDLVTYPVQMITGFVEDFTWQPGEKIFAGEEGKVELLTPDVNVLQANVEIQSYMQGMEEMAGAPKEAMGFRTPGEKTKYEVQRLENAASRLFQNKINQFSEEILEPLLNAMLELARRNMVQSSDISIFDNETKAQSFQTLTIQDITGSGRIKPVAARHFTEQAELIQNLTALTGSGVWPTVMPHFSGVKIAEIVEDTFNLKEYEVFTPYIAISEQAEAQSYANSTQERVAKTTMTATGMGDDYDMDMEIPEEGM